MSGLLPSDLWDALAEAFDSPPVPPDSACLGGEAEPPHDPQPATGDDPAEGGPTA